VRKSSEYPPYVKLTAFLEKGEEFVASARKMCSRARWEIRIIAWNMWGKPTSLHPRILEYTGPRRVLSENRARREVCSLEDYMSGNCEFTIEKYSEKVLREKIRSCLLNGLEEVVLSVGGRI